MRPLHVVLFLATCLTTTMQGALMFGGLAPGLAFSGSLMLILVTHEAGHYVVARGHGVPASLPYFIPLPPPLGFGTLGAVIGMRPSEDRNQIIDIGAAGPLAGLAVAVPVVVYGLAHSPVGPIPPGAQLEGNSILYMVAKRLVTGHWLPGGGLDVSLGPVAQAGWFGLFITMFNLIPIGQLDGGHVATGYFGSARYERVSRWLHRILPLWAAGAFAWVLLDGRRGGLGWRPAASAASFVGVSPLVWWGMLLLLRRAGGGRYHPPLRDTDAVTPGRRWLARACALTFLLIWVPWPFRLGPT